MRLQVSVGGIKLTSEIRYSTRTVNAVYEN